MTGSLAWSLVFDLVLRAVATAFLLATAMRLWAKHRTQPAGIPGALLCGGLIAYLAAPHLLAPDRATPLSFLILLAAIANPGLIWLVARGLFRERTGVGRTQVLAVGSAVLLGLVFAYELPRTLFGSSAFVEFASRVVPHGLALAFILLAIIDAQRDVRNDLVEPRRRLRMLFVTSIAVYAAIVAVVETALRGERPPPALELLHLGLVAGASLAAVVVIYRYGDELLGPAVAPAREPDAPLPSELAEPRRTDPAEPPPVQRPAELHPEPTDPLRAALEAWLARQGFLEPELTIAGLAKTLRTQEYKVRRLLNGELGFRNFNDFLHRHRIRVACERLTRPGPETSILELSMAVGYRSLATFNRAFKEVTGLNPTEYRARHGVSKTS
jgi:AraC-like DNA-binding protein